MNAHASAFTVKEVLNASWELSKKNWKNFIVAFFDVFLIVALGMVVQGILMAVGLPEIISTLINLLLSVFIINFTAKFAIAIARGDKMVWNELLKIDGKTFLNMLAATILMNIIVTVGLVLLVIPGIIASLMFAFYSFSIVDKQAGIIQSLEDSMEMTKGHKWTMFGVFLALVGIVVGVIAVPLILAITAAALKAGILSVVIGVIMVPVLIVLIVLVTMVSWSAQGYMYLKLRAATPFKLAK